MIQLSIYKELYPYLADLFFLQSYLLEQNINLCIYMGVGREMYL